MQNTQPQVLGAQQNLIQRTFVSSDDQSEIMNECEENSLIEKSKLIQRNVFNLNTNLSKLNSIKSNNRSEPKPAINDQVYNSSNNLNVIDDQQSSDKQYPIQPHVQCQQETNVPLQSQKKDPNLSGGQLDSQGFIKMISPVQLYQIDSSKYKDYPQIKKNQVEGASATATENQDKAAAKGLGKNMEQPKLFYINKKQIQIEIPDNNQKQQSSSCENQFSGGVAQQQPFQSSSSYFYPQKKSSSHIDMSLIMNKVNELQKNENNEQNEQLQLNYGSQQNNNTSNNNISSVNGSSNSNMKIFNTISSSKSPNNLQSNVKKGGQKKNEDINQKKLQNKQKTNSNDRGCKRTSSSISAEKKKVGGQQIEKKTTKNSSEKIMQTPKLLKNKKNSSQSKSIEQLQPTVFQMAEGTFGFHNNTRQQKNVESSNNVEVLQSQPKQFNYLNNILCQPSFSEQQQEWQQLQPQSQQQLQQLTPKPYKQYLDTNVGQKQESGDKKSQTSFFLSTQSENKKKERERGLSDFSIKAEKYIADNAKYIEQLRKKHFSGRALSETNMTSFFDRQVTPEKGLRVTEGISPINRNGSDKQKQRESFIQNMWMPQSIKLRQLSKDDSSQDDLLFLTQAMPKASSTQALLHGVSMPFKSHSNKDKKRKIIGTSNALAPQGSTKNFLTSESFNKDQEGPKLVQQIPLLQTDMIRSSQQQPLQGSNSSRKPPKNPCFLVAQLQQQQQMSNNDQQQMNIELQQQNGLQRNRIYSNISSDTLAQKHEQLLKTPVKEVQLYQYLDPQENNQADIKYQTPNTQVTKQKIAWASEDNNYSGNPYLNKGNNNLISLNNINSNAMTNNNTSVIITDTSIANQSLQNSNMKQFYPSIPTHFDEDSSLYYGQQPFISLGGGNADSTSKPNQQIIKLNLLFPNPGGQNSKISSIRRRQSLSLQHSFSSSSKSNNERVLSSSSRQHRVSRSRCLSQSSKKNEKESSCSSKKGNITPVKQQRQREGERLQGVSNSKQIPLDSALNNCFKRIPQQQKLSAEAQNGSSGQPAANNSGKKVEENGKFKLVLVTKNMESIPIEQNFRSCCQSTSKENIQQVNEKKPDSHVKKLVFVSNSKKPKQKGGQQLYQLPRKQSNIGMQQSSMDEESKKLLQKKNTPIENLINQTSSSPQQQQKQSYGENQTSQAINKAMISIFKKIETCYDQIHNGLLTRQNNGSIFGSSNQLKMM